MHTGRYVAALERGRAGAGRIGRSTPRHLALAGLARRGAPRGRRGGGGGAAVAAGEAERAFCAVRPPGHHAGAETPMGFCLYSNVAIGARVAQAAGLARVAVVDFDVHHGNGTQDIFDGEPGLFFASIHQSPGWPGTGDPARAPASATSSTPPCRPTRRASSGGGVRGADGAGGRRSSPT